MLMVSGLAFTQIQQFLARILARGFEHSISREPAPFPDDDHRFIYELSLKVKYDLVASLVAPDPFSSLKRPAA